MGVCKQGLPPFSAKVGRPPGGSDRRKASAFKHQPVNLALADDDFLRLGQHPLPAVKLGARTWSCQHFGTVGFVLGILCQFEKGKLPTTVEYGHRDPAAVPA